MYETGVGWGKTMFLFASEFWKLFVPVLIPLPPLFVAVLKHTPSMFDPLLNLPTPPKVFIVIIHNEPLSLIWWFIYSLVSINCSFGEKNISLEYPQNSMFKYVRLCWLSWIFHSHENPVTSDKNSWSQSIFVN
jgi:hypothetical protein